MLSHVSEEPWDCVSELQPVPMSCFCPVQGFKEFITRVPLIIPDFIVACGAGPPWPLWLGRVERAVGLGRLVCKR